MASLVTVVEVSCPRHGPKAGLFLKGVLTPIPFVIEQEKVERAQPLCFECRDVGIRRNCRVIMEPVGEVGA